MSTGRQRQADIYLGGLRGLRPVVPFAYDKLEAAAQANMSKAAFAYIAGGAGRERTMATNRNAFDRWRIVPRMLRDISTRDLSVELLGQTLASPFLLSPIGVLEMAHRDADLAVARVAASEGVPFIFSTQASVPMEQTAAAMGDALRWYQLYWSKSNDLVISFVQRAEACGCQAIVVTLDTQILGWRTRDLDLAYLPFLRAKGIAQYTSDPVFQRLMHEPDPDGPAPKPKLTLTAIASLIEMARNYPGALGKNLTSGKPLKAVRAFIRLFARPSLTWANLAFLRDHTSLPILLKGILHPDDARKALDHGVDGLYVSNHGGRQVDGSLGALDELPAIAEVVQGRIPIVFDSGIRTGADVFKALALGATAVGLGRPYCYGLALAGEAGVREVIRNFKADFDITMALAGCRSVAEITPETLVAA